VAEYVSDHLAPFAVDAVRQIGYRAPAAIADGIYRKKRAHVNLSTAVVADDVIHMMKFKSGDRLFDLSITVDGASDNTFGRVGIWIVQPDGTGSLTEGGTGDDNVFASGLGMNALVPRTEIFKEEGTLKDSDRGKPLWEILEVGTSAGVVADPMLEYYISIKIEIAVATATENIILEAGYTSGS
jgi:hypothetical protein